MCDLLVLEDNPDVLEVVHLALEDRGYTVREASAPEAALNVLRSTPACQIILTDIDLGAEMNGFAVVEEARRSRPDLLAVYYSGHERAPADRPLRQNERYLSKPFSRLELFSTLQELGVRPSRSPLPR
jgi:CheY-like chemotaxis protein